MNSIIKVVNKYKHQPTEHDVYIGRGSVLGNPFTHQDISSTKAHFQCSTRGEAIANYRKYLTEELKAGNKKMRAEIKRIVEISQQGDLNLVCFCKPKSCHGDIIKEIIEKIVSKMKKRA